MYVPPSPQWNARNIAWTVVLAVVIYLGTAALYLLAHWAAIIPSAILLVAAVYLIGGELFNERGT